MTDLFYLNARMRAMRGRMMRRPHYETLLAEPDLPAFAARLMEGPYAPTLESAGAGNADPGRLEEAFRRQWSKTLTELSRRADGDPREAVRIVLGFWDLHNLKTLLRGKANGMPAEAIQAALVPAGCIDEAVLVELLNQPDLRAAAALLVHRRDPAARALSAAMADYHEPRDLFILETVLERDYFRRAFLDLDRLRLAEADRAAL
ncbi:MAG TPA: V-type ATPase subunit, partial [Nitrospiria bacterium]